MKQNKLFIVLICLLLFVSILSVVSFALVPIKNNDLSIVNDHYINQEAPKTKDFTPSNKETKVLTYKYTEKITQSEYMDIYLHNSDEYWFNSQGKLLAFSKSSPIITDNSLISEQQACEIASSHISEIYGRLSGYVFDYCEYSEETQSYYIRYTMYLDNNRLICADICSVTVYKDGTLTFSRAPNAEFLTGYSDSLIKNIDKDFLTAYVETQISSIYANTTIPMITLNNNIWIHKSAEDEFYLSLPVTITKADGTVFIQEFIYELE